MAISRRRILQGVVAAPAVIASARLGNAAPTVTLKISHQFPGGTIDEGDFRDRLCRKFAAELEKRTNGAIVAQVYPNSSLMKTVAQFSAVRKGALDLSLYPISYAGGEYRGAQHRPDAGTGFALTPRAPPGRRRRSARSFSAPSWPRRASSSCRGSGRRAALPAGGPDHQSAGRQGPEGARRQPRDGHGAAGGGRDHAVARRRTSSMPRCRPGPATPPSRRRPA